MTTKSRIDSSDDDLFISSSSKVKLSSDSFEETYQACMRRSSRLCLKDSNKKKLWKQWDLEEKGPRTSLRTYSRKKESEGDAFEALVGKFVRPSWASESDEGVPAQDEEEVFSPDDGPLFASPLQGANDSVSAAATTPQSGKRIKRCVKLSLTSTPEPGYRSLSRILFSRIKKPESPIHKLNKRPVVLLQALTNSVIESYTKDSVTCLCSSFDEDNVLECDYCPSRVHAACHGVLQEEYDQIIEIGLLWSCPKCSKCPKDSNKTDVDVSGSGKKGGKKSSVACLCSSFDEDNVLDCDYCPSQVHAACHGVRQEEYDQILESGLLWSCPKCSECPSSNNNNVTSDRAESPLSESDSPDKNLIQAKGGKKWRRTMAAHLLQSPGPNGRISEEIDVSKRLGELSLLEQQSGSMMSYVEYEEDFSSPMVDILFCCQQTEILTFEDLYDREIFEKSRKVGEGTFGEVYLLHGLDTESEYPPVLKVIPVDGSQPVNEEPQTSLPEVLTEIQISLSLSSLVERGLTANFVEIHMCHLVAGGYPNVLLDLWDAYDKEKQSLNIRPDYLGSDQKYIAFEFGNGGTDLETTELFNADQGLAIFKQVAHAIAVAEVEFSFEHRDLHWGNILIQGTEEDAFVYHLDENSTYCVFTSGVKATIIDFSLSRLSIHELDVDIFKDIAEDETLFNAVGDYQFEIYRLMKKSNHNDWKSFNPYTNVLWLHYLLDKLISSVPYKAVKSRAHRTAMTNLRRFKKNMLSFGSAKDFVLSHGAGIDD